MSAARRQPPCVRWTMGDVAPFGFDALRLSIWGAWRLFGRDARFVVCVNTLDVDEARRRAGALPPGVEWRHVTRAELPHAVRAHLDAGMAEGTGWKLAPARLDAGRHELSLDNDCILWAVPAALRRWLDASDRRVVAEDVRPSSGQFADLVDDAPRNLGIRGLPPAFDLEGALAAVLAAHPVTLASELDEQGLQLAALARDHEPEVVSVDDVTICSPFWPHRPELGRCGAHFVGLNSRTIPWDYYGRPAIECRHEHWLSLRDRVAELVGAPRSWRAADVTAAD